MSTKHHTPCAGCDDAYRNAGETLQLIRYRYVTDRAIITDNYCAACIDVIDHSDTVRVTNDDAPAHGIARPNTGTTYYRAHFTGAPCARCETCGTVFVYWDADDIDELGNIAHTCAPQDRAQ